MGNLLSQANIKRVIFGAIGAVVILKLSNKIPELKKFLM